MKKIISSIMALMLVLSMAIPVSAAEQAQGVETIVGNIKGRSLTTIEDIDLLVEERNQAYLEENYELVDNLTNELHACGMGTITLEELNELIGNEQVAATRSGATFETVYSTYSTGGKTYDIMRVYATPTTSSNLYMTGVTAVKNSASAQANAMSFVNITVQAAAGLASNTISAVQTVYGALKSYISALSTTSTIKNISSSYTWNAAETCVFVYVKSSVTGAWMQAAQYSKATATVTVVTPTLNYGTSGAITSAITKTYSGSATPTNYNSTAKAVTEYLGAGLYDQARVNKIVIKGIEGKAVKTINLLNPDIPGMIS